MNQHCPRHDGRRTVSTCRYGGCKLVQSKPGPRVEGVCFYCGEEGVMTVDHVIPQSMGRHFRAAWNKVMACDWCNRKKAARLPLEWLYEWLDTPSAQHPRQARIKARRRHIVEELLARPELARYRPFIDGKAVEV